MKVANISIGVNGNGIGENTTLYGISKDTIFNLSIIELEFIVTDITDNTISINFNKEENRFKIMNNTINVGEEIKLVDPISPSIDINIKLLEIKDKEARYYE